MKPFFRNNCKNYCCWWSFQVQKVNYQMTETLFEKIWNSHVVVERENEPSLIYIDRHLIHEVTSPQAFDGLRVNNRKGKAP